MRRKLPSGPMRYLPLGLALAFVLLTVPASAKTTALSLKERTFTAKTAAVEKKASVIRKGRTILKLKREGFLKFKAPKKGTWRFSFSGITSTESEKSRQDINGVSVAFYKENDLSHLLDPITVRVKGGKTDSVELITAYGYALQKPSSVFEDTPLPARTAVLTLKKGQVIYLDVFAVNPCSVTVAISRG